MTFGIIVSITFELTQVELLYTSSKHGRDNVDPEARTRSNASRCQTKDSLQREIFLKTSLKERNYLSVQHMSYHGQMHAITNETHHYKGKQMDDGHMPPAVRKMSTALHSDIKCIH